MIPRASRSGVKRGTHITERILRSAIDALVGRFLSAPASWLRTAFFWPSTWLTIDRLMLIGISSAGMTVEKIDFLAGRYLNALRISRLVSGSTSTRKSRSAWGKSSMSESRILGATVSILSSVERLRADLEDRLELDLGLDHARHGARTRGVERVQMRGVVVFTLGDDHDVAGFLGGAVRRQLRVKQELDVADIDPVSGRQAMIDSRNDLGVVDLGQVPGVEIGQIIIFALAIDLGMPAADAVGVEDDVAMLGRPADDDSIGLQLDDLPGRLAVGSFQKCHAGRLPPRNRRRGPFS